MNNRATTTVSSRPFCLFPITYTVQAVSLKLTFSVFFFMNFRKIAALRKAERNPKRQVN